MTATTRSRTSRWRAASFAALACVLTVPVVFSHAQEPGTTCRLPGQFKRVPPLWTEVRAPQFPAGPATISAYAVTPWNPDILFATNGTAVMRSGDGGCIWQAVLTLQPDGGGDVSLSSQLTKITSIVIPAARNAQATVYLTALQAGEGVGRPFVLYSRTQGDVNSWSLRSSGLPAVGRPSELAIAPSSSSALYLALRSVPGLPVGAPTIPGTPVQTSASGALYRSTDGGSSWTRASDGNDFDGAPAIDDIAVDSSRPATVWTVAGGRLRVSRDSGATHAPPVSLGESRQAAYDFTAVNVHRSRVIGFSRTGGRGPSALVSTNSGSSFEERRTPGVVASTAHTDKTSSLIIGTGSGGGSSDIYRWATNGSSTRLTPIAHAADWDVQVDSVYNNVYAFRPTALYKTITDRTQKPQPIDPNILKGGVGTVPPVVANIKPRRVEISLPPGGTTTRDFTITLPPSPTKLDLFLIMDDSRSMNPLISRVKKNLATVLQKLVTQEKIDVYAGIAKYGTTEDPPLYERLADVQSPNTGEVYTALKGLTAENTGQSEPVLIALHQAATGKGLNKIPGVPLSFCDLQPIESATCGIEPNQNANWRAQSLRVFVHATNERFIENLDDVEDRDEPSFTETAQAMRDRGIQHIGIVAAEEARPHLKQMSELTGTLAPTSVDCDGDGAADLRPGDPLVCADSGDLSKMMVEVLKAVRDVQPVGIFSRSGSPVFKGVRLSGSLASPRQQAEFSAVNVKVVNTLRYRATFSCVGVAPSPTPYEVKLSAQLRGETLRGADATAMVTCGALVAGVPATAPDPGIPAGPQPQVQPQPLPAQPAPAVPALQIQPAPQVQVNTQVNPQAGAARQEEKEFQFATATNDVLQDEREGGAQLAMSVLTGVALMGAFGTAHAMRRREADRLAKVYTYRR